MHPTHYCTECGALWRQCDDGSWNLRSETAGPCCDNAPMKDQIKPLAAPSAQAEPVAWMWETVESGTRVSLNEPADYEQVFHLTPLYAAPPTAQAESQEPLPFNSAQRRRLWENSHEIHADAKSFAAFERIVQLVELAHGIGKQEL